MIAFSLWIVTSLQKQGQAPRTSSPFSVSKNRFSNTTNMAEVSEF